MKLRSVAAVLLLVSCRAFLGCSSESVAGPVGDAGASDAAPTDAAQSDEGLDAAPDSRLATCNDFPQQGSPVRVFNTQSPPPAAAGGTLTDGTWVLTGAMIWASSAQEGISSGLAAAQTWTVRGSTVDIVSMTAKTKTVTRSSGTITPSGTELTLKQTCAYPADAGLGESTTTPFSATATTLLVYYPSGPTTYELTYTKK